MVLSACKKSGTNLQLYLMHFSLKMWKKSTRVRDIWWRLVHTHTIFAQLNILFSYEWLSLWEKTRSVCVVKNICRVYICEGWECESRAVTSARERSHINVQYFCCWYFPASNRRKAGGTYLHVGHYHLVILIKSIWTGDSRWWCPWTARKELFGSPNVHIRNK